MNTFIFVSVICVAQACGFMTSTDYISEKECNEYKQEFIKTKFDSSVTLAAYQCMKFKPGIPT
jgi:hypothetical protein